MTMHQPRAGIVRDEADNEPSVRWQHSHVPAHGVRVLQDGRVREDAGAGAEEVEVVAV